MAAKENTLRKYLDKHVYNQIRTVIIFAVVFGLGTVYEIVAFGFNLPLAASSFLLGLLVGIFVSRRYKLSWDSETNQVVSSMDRIGLIIFVLYIIFMISRSFIVSYWEHGAAYFGIIFAITAGVMVGRLVATRHALKKIRENLEEIRKSLS